MPSLLSIYVLLRPICLEKGMISTIFPFSLQFPAHHIPYHLWLDGSHLTCCRASSILQWPSKIFDWHLPLA